MISIGCLASLCGCTDIYLAAHGEPSVFNGYREKPPPPDTRGPGLYGITFDGGEINGEVGHPLTLASARATCLPDHDWTTDSRIISGTLPPGLSLNSNNSGISGIPTERGHWVVTQQIYNSECSGRSYQDHERQIIFHITGSGKVVQ
jgi:hypothetical protein